MNKRHEFSRYMTAILNGYEAMRDDTETGALIEIEIGEDFDAMFHFLEFCRKQNNHEPVDDDFCDYLALLITKSQRRCCEEC